MTARTRVYLPASVAALRTLAAGEPWAASAAFAVTPGARDDHAEPDDEELEFAAFLDAARGCLDLLRPEDPPRRVVVSADVPASTVAVRGAPTATAVALAAPLQRADVAAFHVDDAEGARVVQAVRTGADPELLDDVVLAWYDPSELDALLAEVDPHRG